MNHALRAFLPLALTCGVGCARLQAQEQDPPAIAPEAFDEIAPSLAEFAAEHRLPGLAVGVVVGDSLVWSHALGARDMTSGEPVTDATLFQIGSITKSMTATVVALAVDRGLIAWNEPVARHLPADCLTELWTSPDTAPTYRLIASHRSALPGRAPTLSPRQHEGLVRSFTHFELCQSMRAASLDGAPGKRFAYSNFGYAVMGHALERAAGAPFESLLHDWLFAPLGMAETAITVLPAQAQLTATAYEIAEDSGALAPTLAQDLDALAPAGGVWSSVRDLAPFLALHMDAPHAASSVALSDAQREAMLVSVPVGEGQSLRYGLGWGVTALSFGDAVFHDGGSDGFTAYIGFAREQGVGVIVLTNLGSRTIAGPVRGLGHGLLTWAVGQSQSGP